MSATTPVDVPTPPTHLDLFSHPVIAVLTTLDRTGQPQSSLVWADHDGECPRFNTTLERLKGRNLLADPRASLLLVDPANTGRFIQVRGEVELVHQGGLEHLDGLTRKFTRHPRFYGHVYPAQQAARETRVIGRVHARRITVDAIHA